ncbi:MAG: outer membrane lipoprotein-sorting protein [Acidobacteriia bacterium]|nr:outer membrane lipoprotein-sorting protein [Terriglobia bacterium]
MRRFVPLAFASLLVSGLLAEDAREIVRKSVALDQANWLRMKDYTWIAKETERSLDSKGQVKSEQTDAWETVILFGEPHRRMLERNGKPLSAGDERKEQEKLDRAVAKLARESDEQRQRRLEKSEKEREKERDFLREVVDLYDFRLEGEDTMEGRNVWLITATPKPAYQPKHREGKALLKIRGKLWIDKTEYQWVRIEAETTDTISFGLFIARLNPGARLVFEQTRVNDQIWLPKREVVSGSGRLGLIKKIALEQETTWNNYRKFQVDSKIIATQ